MTEGWREDITSSSSICSEFSPFPKLQESTWALQHYPQIKLPIPFHLYCQTFHSLQTRGSKTKLCTICQPFMMLSWRCRSHSASWMFHQSRPCSERSAWRCLRSSGCGTSATLPSGSGRTWTPMWWWQDGDCWLTRRRSSPGWWLGRCPAASPSWLWSSSANIFNLFFFKFSLLTFFMKLLLRIKLLGDPFSGVIGGGFSSSRSPGMKFSSLSESLVQNMSTLVETLRWLLKLTFLISFRISVKSLMSRWCDIMTRMSQSPKPRLNLAFIVTLTLNVWEPIFSFFFLDVGGPEKLACSGWKTRRYSLKVCNPEPRTCQCHNPRNMEFFIIKQLFVDAFL